MGRLLFAALVALLMALTLAPVTLTPCTTDAECAALNPGTCPADEPYCL